MEQEEVETELVRSEAACLAAFCSTRTIWLRTQIALPQELASKSQKRLYNCSLGLLLAQTACGIAQYWLYSWRTGDFSPTKSARFAMQLSKPPPSSPAPFDMLPAVNCHRFGSLWGGDVVSIAACRRMPNLSARFGGCALRESCPAQRLVLFEHAGAKAVCNYIKRRRASSRVETNRGSYKFVQPETKPQAIPQHRPIGSGGAAQNHASPPQICPSGREGCTSSQQEKTVARGGETG